MAKPQKVERAAKAAKGKKSYNPAFGNLVSRVSNLEELVVAIAEFVEYPLPADNGEPEPEPEPEPPLAA